MDSVKQRYKFSQAIQEQLVNLRKLDNWHCIFGILYDYFVIAFAVTIFLVQHWLYPISIILIGSRQRALATILHEAAHLCIAKSRRWNQIVGTYLSGYLILQEFDSYRDSHVKRHHAYLGHPENDPDYKYHIEQKLYEYKGCFEFFKEYILKPLFLLKAASYTWYLIKHRLLPNRLYVHNYIKMFSMWATIFVICSYFHVIYYLLILWFVPLLTTAALFGWFNELAEHYPLIGKHTNEMYMTRNRFSHWLEHFLFNTHNENYHLIHHLQATIPYWNLKKAHEIMCQDPVYANLNENMGGIFASKNRRIPSLIKRFMSEPTINKQGQVQYE